MKSSKVTRLETAGKIYNSAQYCCAHECKWKCYNWDNNDDVIWKHGNNNWKSLWWDGGAGAPNTTSHKYTKRERYDVWLVDWYETSCIATFQFYSLLNSLYFALLASYQTLLKCVHFIIISLDKLSFYAVYLSLYVMWIIMKSHGNSTDTLWSPGFSKKATKQVRFSDESV